MEGIELTVVKRQWLSKRCLQNCRIYWIKGKRIRKLQHAFTLLFSKIFFQTKSFLNKKKKKKNGWWEILLLFLNIKNQIYTSCHFSFNHFFKTYFKSFCSNIAIPLTPEGPISGIIIKLLNNSIKITWSSFEKSRP